MSVYGRSPEAEPRTSFKKLADVINRVIHERWRALDFADEETSGTPCPVNDLLEDQWNVPANRNKAGRWTSLGAL